MVQPRVDRRSLGGSTGIFIANCHFVNSFVGWFQGIRLEHRKQGEVNNQASRPVVGLPRLLGGAGGQRVLVEICSKNIAFQRKKHRCGLSI